VNGAIPDTMCVVARSENVVLVKLDARGFGLNSDPLTRVVANTAGEYGAMMSIVQLNTEGSSMDSDTSTDWIIALESTVGIIS
jgi:hypothetical protein